MPVPDDGVTVSHESDEEALHTVFEDRVTDVDPAEADGTVHVDWPKAKVAAPAEPG